MKQTKANKIMSNFLAINDEVKRLSLSVEFDEMSNEYYISIRTQNTIYDAQIKYIMYIVKRFKLIAQINQYYSNNIEFALY